MPQGHNFEAPGLIERPVDQFSLQSNYSDKTYVREILAWESFRDGGAPYHQAFPARIHKNGQFFGLYTYLEAPDADWVKRTRAFPLPWPVAGTSWRPLDAFFAFIGIGAAVGARVFLH